MRTPYLSVVVPVYNEEAGLPALFARLYPALDALAVPYEVIFVNDGSRDRSAALLKDQFQARPDVTRVVLFNANYGQHLAIIAGFEHSRGQRVVTLDADTRLPRGAVGRLVGTMAHPLNQALLDPRKRRVTEGYGVLQPRITAALPAVVSTVAPP